MIPVRKDIYVKTTSLDLWWGVYGLSPLTGWEDILLYSTPNDTEKLAGICICCKNYMESGLVELASDPDEQEFLKQVQKYLEDDKIYYHYYYDHPKDEDLFELHYNNLPLNENNVKPRSIELWHPGPGIDIRGIEECIKDFCYKHLSMEVSVIQFIEPLDLNQAIKTFNKHMNMMNSPVVFTDDLIDSMSHKLSKSRDEIISLLKKSLK
ncbi:hypothetical protein [Paenibacillus sp. RC67]|uniref:hypothetical protein n=1 Tax=Paenibacillus sp. RC67 TaxID=3039392 RepID=UPI0024ACFDEA|nr:hypothetical protein [Paenibacillus sp. RC67]